MKPLLLEIFWRKLLEDIIEILEEAVTERLEIAYFKLIKENEEVKQGVEMVKELSIKLYENTDIPKEVKKTDWRL